MDNSRNRRRIALPDYILHPEHVAQIGQALWVFLWLWREGPGAEGSWADGGYCRDGQRIQIAEIARGLGITARTVRRHLAKLRELLYVEIEFVGKGMEVWVEIRNPDEPAGEAEPGSGPSGQAEGRDSQPAEGKPEGTGDGSKVGRAGSRGEVPTEKDQTGTNSARTYVAGQEQLLPGQIWPGKGQNEACPDKSGRAGTIIARPNMARQAPETPCPAKCGQAGTPRTPLKGLRDIKSTCCKSKSSSSSDLPPLDYEPSTNNVIPIHPRNTEGASGGGAPGAVGVGDGGGGTMGVRTLRKLLGWIEGWERPELTGALRKAFSGLSEIEAGAVFDVVRSRSLTMGNGKDDPKAWWAAMLCRTAKGWTAEKRKQEGEGKES